MRTLAGDYPLARVYYNFKLSEPALNVRDIMNVLSNFINRETKYVAIFCDIIILNLLK